MTCKGGYSGEFSLLCSGPGQPMAYCTPSHSRQVRRKTHGLPLRTAALSPEHHTLGRYQPDAVLGPRGLFLLSGPVLSPPCPGITFKPSLGSADYSFPKQPSIYPLLCISTNVLLPHESVRICSRPSCCSPPCPQREIFKIPVFSCHSFQPGSPEWRPRLAGQSALRISRPPLLYLSRRGARFRRTLGGPGPPTRAARADSQRGLCSCSGLGVDCLFPPTWPP